MTDSDRFEALEIKLAHLERGLQELSEVLTRQQQEIDRLSQRNQQLLQQLEADQDRFGEKDKYEIPPHY
jgi:SlyX protein